MARVVVGGGSIAGLATALLVARAGHDVTIIERDPSEPPESVEDAWKAWRRRGVQQFRQIHGYKVVVRDVLKRLAPDVLGIIYVAGAIDDGFEDSEISDPKERSVSLRCRRTTFEWALRRCVNEDSRIIMRQGEDVTGFLTDRTGKRVTGLRTSQGNVEGDLVVDAAGRRSPMPAWCADAGFQVPAERRVGTDQVYLTQWFRRETPFSPADPVVIIRLHFANLAFVPADEGWWSASFWAPERDEQLRSTLMSTSSFLAALQLFPEAAQWLEESTVEGRVLFLSKIVNQVRDLRIVPGLVSLGDSLVCTNPEYGYGFGHAFLGAAELARIVGEPHDPAPVAETFARWSRARISPWFEDSVALDAEINYVWNNGGSVPPPQGNRLFSLHEVISVTGVDPVVRRAYARSKELLRPPDEFWTDPEIAVRVRAATDSGVSDVLVEHPTREELLEAASRGGSLVSN